ncbi:23S rRNA pseudouridine(2604) synthase RluF [Neolewinella aurantiaca]|uniref:Pseudouridine synthase n=1 Tax=Neolewinella aurantiaca TaxID=2602767 RepID=A0A5C7FIF2_9BACT|nr:23S rRNA pseudouridine(2604) synthase RluF [Neolewinella aurantiaca]TXF87097.1 23S rRNA pseudouridine(2604) synthase RluF [Neolewinella aurantiaca]
MPNDTSTSINKFIAGTGMCSRREADKMLDAGRVMLNGTVARKGNRVEPGDDVTVDGKSLTSKPPAVYLALHKPPGITCTTDRRDKTNIIDFVNYPERIFPIGRLDKPSTGLILLTNDGDIVNKILRVENAHDKEYIVTVNKPINREFIKRMAGGLPILDQVTKKCEVEKLGKFKFRIILTQGLNRQIRRMCEYLGFEVQTLKRIRIMNVRLDKLPVGEWRELREDELEVLMANTER